MPKSNKVAHNVNHCTHEKLCFPPFPALPSRTSWPQSESQPLGPTKPHTHTPLTATLYPKTCSRTEMIPYSSVIASSCFNATGVIYLIHISWNNQNFKFEKWYNLSLLRDQCVCLEEENLLSLGLLLELKGLMHLIHLSVVLQYHGPVSSHLGYTWSKQFSFS